MKKCGIYFCLKQGVIVYIGQTIDLMNRMWYHQAQILDHDAVRFIPCSKENLTYYETRWIQRFKPVENHTHKGLKKYYYYRPKLRQNAKAQRFHYKNVKMKFRVMTEKSLVGFGRFTDSRLEQVINNGKIIDVVMMYFGLSHISFCEELLIKLKITNEWRIEKPGTNHDFGYEFLEKNYPELMEKREDRRSLNILKNAKRSLNGEIRNNTSDRNRMKNHGHF